MARFAIDTAFADAFRLIRGRPISVFVWGLLVVVPVIVGLGLMMPMMGAMIVEDIHGGLATGPDFARMLQFQGLSGLLNIVQMLVLVVVYTAIMRAIVRPTERAFFSLRIGMDELRVAVVGLAIMVGIYAAVFALGLLGVAIGFGVWQMGAPTNWLIIVAMVLILVVGVWLAMARLSLLAPASVLYRTFAFAEGWKLGRGQTGRLFGMMLLLCLMILAIEMVLVMIGMVVLGITATGMNWTEHMHDAAMWTDLEDWREMTPWLIANWPWCVLLGVVLSFLYGMFVTLAVAPFASACRQLAESSVTPEPAPIVQDAAPSDAVEL
ncbi:hypothetical protein [uncultured Brevundimonas sp.]|uniref:hypothetical protein n=1 Tax=uncultured Brevundimonas sp. TaxID=213418 RepID=UPI0030ED4443|tara:strand:- start:295 stop:1263 length:969 start_codon:yes stop_codon:yes gene_type:complete